MIDKIKEKIDEIFDVLGTMLVALIIVTLNIIIGANEKEFRVLPLGIYLLFIIIYLLIKKIKFKEKIAIKNKLDLIVLLFMIATTLPLIFKTYCTYQGNMEFILKYFFSYAFYLLVRNTINTTEKTNTIITVTVCASLIPIILGIDELYFGKLTPILEMFNLRYTSSARLAAPFGYSNTAAVYMAFCIFLAINVIQNQKDKLMKIYMALYIILASATMYLTNSRAVFALFAVGIFVYLVVMYKDNISQNKKSLGKIFLGLIILAIACGIYCIIGLNYSVPYYIKEVDSGTIRKKFNPNQEYEFQIDMECENENHEPIQIAIVENNKYLFRKKIAVLDVTDFSEIQTIKFTPTEEFLTIEYRIYNYSCEKVKVNKYYLDGEEYIFNYKYIPNSIGRLLKSFSLKELSVKQRLDFYIDSLKIAKEHPLIGQGGNTWKMKHRAIQDYNYHVKETHSYFFELLISYGIIGVSLYLALVIFMNVKVIKICLKDKEKIKHKLAILIGLDLVILHSLVFDFDMSYVLIQITVFGFIAMLIQDYNEEKIKNKYVDVIVFGLLISVFFVYLCGIIGQYCVENKNIKSKIAFYDADLKYTAIYKMPRKNENFKENLEETKKIIEKNPYYSQTEVYDLYSEIVIRNMDKMSNEEIVEYILWIIQKFETVSFATPMDIDTITPRVEVMKNIIKALKKLNSDDVEIINIIDRLKNIVNTEYEQNIINIRDVSRNGEKEEKVQRIEKDYNYIIKSIEK